MLQTGCAIQLFRGLGNSPAALEQYLNFSGARAGGALDAEIVESAGNVAVNIFTN